MKRKALVIGINRYPFLRDSATAPPRHLTAPARDAGAIARFLELYGDFQVRRFPTSQDEWEFDSTGLVVLEELKTAIDQLFQPKEDSPPDTALLFFAGIGLRREGDRGETEGFLATSDASPRKHIWGVSLKWLRQLLLESTVAQQVIWLDCSYSGELFNFPESETETEGSDRCFIVASRDSESAYAHDGHGLLTTALIQGIDPKSSPEGMVNSHTLTDSIARKFAEEATPQHPVFQNAGEPIVLTGDRRVMSYLFKQDPLESLWTYTDGWFSKDHPLMTHNFVGVSGNSSYREEVNRALGVELPKKWWENPESGKNLYESLKSLCGDTFYGHKATSKRYISVGAAYLMALMAHQRAWNCIEPLTDNVSDWVSWKKAASSYLFPVQDRETAVASAKALYDFFFCLFEQRDLARHSQVKTAFFQGEGKMLVLEFEWSADRAAENRNQDDSLAQWTSKILAEESVTIPAKASNTRAAILRLWRNMLASQKGFMGPGVVYMEGRRLVVASTT
ncbi:MAG: caspase family protein [Oscillatoria sp. SIO1A7]|nr:caspase family protein [Oscillatoria sp. SIO1A7]